LSLRLTDEDCCPAHSGQKISSDDQRMRQHQAFCPPPLPCHLSSRIFFGNLTRNLALALLKRTKVPLHRAPAVMNITGRDIKHSEEELISDDEL
jgi:hypothetical protein